MPRLVTALVTASHLIDAGGALYDRHLTAVSGAKALVAEERQHPTSFFLPFSLTEETSCQTQICSLVWRTNLIKTYLP